jgi:Starch-binding associating with outer membrane
MLVSLSDPRLPVYAFPAVSDGQYRGFQIGAKAQPQLTSISHIGKKYRKDPAGFSPWMRYAEVMFEVAEAAKKGFTTGTTAEVAYNKAVTASMLENGVLQADIDTYLAGTGKFDNTLDQIYLQQWLAMFKQGMEGWSLYRRTGIPKTLYVAPGSAYTGHNNPPFRYPYPVNQELTYNKANAEPYINKVKDDFWGQQMWYDTRTGAQ